MNEIIIICGPTASGKTDIAHSLAKFHGSEVINADSVQIYKDMNILSASPEIYYTNELPYHLYNFLEIDDDFSVAKYAKLAKQKIDEIVAQQKIPILVGGTGMYICALLYGFSEIPYIEQSYRDQARTLQSKMDKEEFYRHLITLDPLSSSLHINDSQRTSRAYEVFLQTGKSIFSFSNNINIHPLKDFKYKIYYMLPNRDFLYKMCNLRLIEMFKTGAIEEVENIIQKNIATNCKAIGFREIVNYLQGRITYKEALEEAQIKTRNYAKRQITWFNNQLREKTILKFSSRDEYDIILKELLN